MCSTQTTQRTSLRRSLGRQAYRRCQQEPQQSSSNPHPIQLLNEHTKEASAILAQPTVQICRRSIIGRRSGRHSLHLTPTATVSSHPKIESGQSIEQPNFGRATADAYSNTFFIAQDQYRSYLCIATSCIALQNTGSCRCLNYQ